MLNRRSFLQISVVLAAGAALPWSAVTAGEHIASLMPVSGPLPPMQLSGNIRNGCSQYPGVGDRMPYIPSDR